MGLAFADKKEEGQRCPEDSGAQRERSTSPKQAAVHGAEPAESGKTRHRGGVRGVSTNVKH